MSTNKDGTTNWVDKANATGIWFTPRRVLDPTDAYFGGQIPYDPCTAPHNPTRARAWTSDMDGGNGLETDWIEESQGEGVFINPPYGKNYDFHAFLEQIHHWAEHSLPIIALLPMGSRFATKYWQRDILIEELNAICWPQGRVFFVDAEQRKAQKNTPFDSQIMGFNVDVSRFKNCYGPLGKTYKMEIQRF